jgi:hypothetical protein
LALAVVGEQAVALGGGEELLFDGFLVQEPGVYPAPEAPGSLIQRRVALPG